jgi:hypothetical protein
MGEAVSGGKQTVEAASDRHPDDADGTCASPAF